jgi:phosphoglycerol transferase MdoB-like AlkP superfamily enzyme
MLRSFFSFSRFFIYWIIIFFVSRIVFEIYFYQKLAGATFFDLLKTFLHGLWLDASATAYISIIPLLVFMISWFIPRLHVRSGWFKAYTWFCLLWVTLLTIADLNIYREWGTKINYRAFATLFDAPSEAMASSGSSPIGLSLASTALLIVGGIILSLYLIDFKYKRPEIPAPLKIGVCIFLAILTFAVIRGGLTGAPLSEKVVYFSNRQILDQATINTEWNLIHDVVENLNNEHNPYLYLKPKEADSLVADLYHAQEDSSVRILTTPHPNVVIIQLESFTANIIASLGGDKGVAPNFENFIKEGVLFDHTYSSGDRTDKGIISILSGFPSQAVRTIITFDSKQKKLPAIPAVLRNNGYHTSYFYGGETNYMNFTSYIRSHGFEDLITESSYDKKEVWNDWGANDGAVLRKNVEYLNKQKEPFFSYIQTSSNHEPFSLRTRYHFPGKELENRFRSTAYFTDSCLNAYFTEAKKQPWYKNTLYVLVADHGHRLPRNSDAFSPEKYHIPLLFFGGAIKEEFRGKRISKLGGQTDIAATVLRQLNLPHQQFAWSKDLLSPYSKSFAFFDWDNGFGFMLPQQAVSFDNAGDRQIYKQDPADRSRLNDKALLYGKAYIQKVYTTFMSY